MNWTILLSALISVESGGDPLAYNKGENAIGLLQVTPVMVEDINRFSYRKFEHIQAYEEDTAIEMLLLYCHHYGFDSYESIARCWVGGPKGMSKKSTLKYWVKVQRAIQIAEKAGK